MEETQKGTMPNVDCVWSVKRETLSPILRSKTIILPVLSVFVPKFIWSLTPCTLVSSRFSPECLTHRLRSSPGPTPTCRLTLTCTQMTFKP